MTPEAGPLPTPLRVLLVTSWGTACGIADYASALKESVEAADVGIAVRPRAEALDPTWIGDVGPFDLVHLNHHDALHARWTPEHVAKLQQQVPVVITYHDTRAGEVGTPNSVKLKAFAQTGATIIVHEPVADVPEAIYWRQGIPAPARRPAAYEPHPYGHGWQDGEGVVYEQSWKAFPQQPVLGTVGFNFPWKNYDRLAQVTGEEGWALVILSNDATEEDHRRWHSLNSSILVVRKFLPQPIAINYLAGCDATAFMYECANNGTSGAIRQGVAARRMVIAHKRCRQFRDLYEAEDYTRYTINWVENWDELRARLRYGTPPSWEASTRTLAHHDSWTRRGQDHAQLYRRLVKARQ